MQIIVELTNEEVEQRKILERKPPVFLWHGKDGWGRKKYLKDKTFYKSADFKEKVLFLVLRFLWDILYKNEHISLTREYLENNGIKLTAAKYDQIAFLDIETGGKYSAYDILRLLKILGLL